MWEEPGVPVAGAVRSVPHSICESRIARRLGEWLDEHLPGGEVASGESGVVLSGRETALGIDVVLFDAETVADQPPPPQCSLNGGGEGIHVRHGVPRLAVEINSAGHSEDKVTAKIAEYLAAGVPQVWEVRPGLRTVTVYRPTAPPATFSGDQPVAGDPELPGFGVRAGVLFGE